MAFANNRSATRIIKKQTRSMKFLQEMHAILPIEKICAIVEASYEKTNPQNWWRPRIATEKMVKMYLLSLWYNLSDIESEDAIYERSSFQRFMDIDITTDQIPDSTTLSLFRNHLNDHGLQKKILDIINDLLKQHGLILDSWTLVDATIVNAPSSTKNEEKKRDPEMSSTRKNNNFFFGGKVHIATDTKGFIKDLKVSTAKVHDSQMYEDLLDDKTEYTIADAWYSGKKLIETAKQKGITHTSMKKRKRGQKSLSYWERLWNTLLSMPRKVVEFPFGVIKNIWWHRKTRYRWLKKLHCLWCWLSAMANLYRARHKLLKVHI